MNAYDALRGGKPGVLAKIDLQRDRPVVTVCTAGRVSQTAAAILSERGFDARSLTGGMKAWSLAWNTAPVPLAGPSARVVQVRRTGKGCLSYVLGSGGEAAVIDPSVASDVYSGIVDEHGWSIRFVLETHCTRGSCLARTRACEPDRGHVAPAAAAPSRLPDWRSNRRGRRQHCRSEVLL